MSEAPKDDEAKFNETLKRMLGTKPKPHKLPDDKVDPARKPDQKSRKPD
ncbi:hypothetical protein [Devosia sp.]|nr:hypothetical protein [Devosia sp.]MBN9310511.1 hypothetical protein [Devosia sp.]